MAECMFCGDELWSHRERGGVCCSCQGLPIDEVGDDEVGTEQTSKEQGEKR